MKLVHKSVVDFPLHPTASTCRGEHFSEDGEGALGFDDLGVSCVCPKRHCIVVFYCSHSPHLNAAHEFPLSFSLEARNAMGGEYTSTQGSIEYIE